MENRRSIFDEYEKHFVEQGKTLAELVFEYKLNYGSLRQHSMKKNWPKKRKDFLEKTNKQLTKITQKRILEQAENINEKNKRRGTYWRIFQNVIINILEERQETLEPKDVFSLVNAYEKCCRGERLEDAQETVVHKIIEDKIQPDPTFQFLENTQMEIMKQEKVINQLAEMLKGKGITVQTGYETYEQWQELEKIPDRIKL
mgnify:CR=1 FL=1